MEYRKLGTTGLETSEIGLGLEYLAKQPSDTVIEVIREAIKNGVNYFDVIFMFPEFLEALGEAIKHQKDKIHLACHFGAGIKDGKHKKMRGNDKAESSFLEMLDMLNVDHAPVAIMQYVSKAEYDKLVAPGKLLDVMLRLKDEEKIGHVGISTHLEEIAMKAIDNGNFEVLMTHVNAVSGFKPEKQEVYTGCAKNNIGLVAIKPFAGGTLLKGGKKVKIASYKAGSSTIELSLPKGIKPSQCLSYSLEQPGVSTVIPGVKNISELRETLKYFTTDDEGKDYATLSALFSG